MSDTHDTHDIQAHAHTALLVMDMQAEIFSRFPQAADLLTPVGNAIAAARVASIPVIYVVVALRPGYPDASPRNKSFGAIKQRATATFSPMTSAEIHSVITPQATDIVVTKRRVSAFSGSDLEVVLRAQDIHHLVLCGIATSGVVLSTLREAADKDYQLTV